ncbi:MAG: hypothetical protein ACPLTR_07090 [Thermacetogeniaceae bacterium]
MQKEEKKIGEQIVGKIDSLIYLIKKAILLSEGKDREKLMNEGYNTVQELALLLEKILGSESGYIMAAIRELLRQRLSDDASAVGGGFFEILEEMISWGKYAKVDMPSDSTIRRVTLTESSDGGSSCDDVQKAISFLFPEAKVAKNYRFYGVNLGYYIPSLNIAVIDEADKKGNRVLTEYLCKSYGIRLIRVNTRELNGYREIARYIKRRLRI